MPGSLTSDPRSASAEAPFVSVIVPVRNEARFIERTLAQLVGQDYDRDRFEVLVVDGESSDGTPALVARFAATHPNVRLFSNPRRLSSAARNIAVREARGDVMLLVDGHCDLAGNRCLRELADAFGRSGADCLGRPQPQDTAGLSHSGTAWPKNARPLTALQRAIASARSSRLGHHPDSHVYSSGEGFVPAKSVAVAYRREVFYRLSGEPVGVDVDGKTIGGFDERFDACEDVEFNHRVDRAGLRCFFTPRIAARYAPRNALGGLFRQLFRYGCGRVRLWRKHPETMSLKTLLPGLFLIGCVVGAVITLLAWQWETGGDTRQETSGQWGEFLGLATSRFPLFYATALALYAAVVLAGSLAVWNAERRKSNAGGRRSFGFRHLALLAWLPLVFATIHFGAGAGLLWELGTGGREQGA